MILLYLFMLAIALLGSSIIFDLVELFNIWRRKKVLEAELKELKELKKRFEKLK